MQATKTEQQSSFTWADYSDYPKRLAFNYTKENLTQRLAKLEGLSDKYAMQHLKAIEKTSSMTGNSQARAQSRNNVSSNYEEKQGLRHAIELLQIYPQLKWTGARVADNEGNEFCVSEIQLRPDKDVLPWVTLKGQGGSKVICLIDLGRLTLLKTN